MEQFEKYDDEELMAIKEKFIDELKGVDRSDIDYLLEIERELTLRENK